MIPLLLSDLKSLTPGANPNDRYYLTDSGKEGEFYLENTYNVPGSTPPASDDAITVNSNTIAGKVYRYRRIVLNGLIKVRWFGASGNGTDQTTALQAALSTTEGNTIAFDNPGGGTFVINTVVVTVASGKVLQFIPGNKLSGTATINGGIIDAGYRQQIFDTTLTLAPAGSMQEMVSVVWFGAGTVADSQAAIQKTIDMVIHNFFLPKTVYFPRGTYTINAPLIVANYNASAQKYDQSTVLLKGEEPGTNRFSQAASNIIANFKDRFAIGFHIAKSGGIQSLNITGKYTIPTMATDAFFNNNPFASYGDPTCRDSIYSPYCGVVIDPFRANSLPADGGYPGNDGAGVALSTYYTKAPNNSTGSGSSGLYFKDVFISNFTVCMIQSPNGQTQNGEGMIYEDIQVRDCKVGFASCQGQEKSNSYRNIICWGTTHTLFSNSDYGTVGSAGNILIDTVNIAGAVNRIFNWSMGGWFPSYFRNIYAESLGAFGTLVSGGVTATVENSLLDFVTPATGSYYPDNHVNITRNISFRNCVMRLYGTGLPVIINGSGVFTECTFETIPVTRIEEASSSPDTIQFNNCSFSSGSGHGDLGSREIIRGGFNQFYNHSLYGDYRLIDANGEKFGVYGEFAIKYHRPRTLIFGAQSKTIAITGTNRVFTFTTTYFPFYQVGDPIFILNGSAWVFAGIVTAVNTGTTTITVSYAPASLANGTYDLYSNPIVKPFRIVGDIVSGSNQATNVIDGSFPGVVGDRVNLPEFAGFTTITAISGTTYTFNSNALITRTGATLVPSSMVYTFNSLNPYAPASTQLLPNTVFKKGDVLIDTYQGVIRRYICIADGMYNPADGRKAYFTLEGNIEYSLTASGSITIPQGFTVEGFTLKSTSSLSALTIGTTSGGTDISSGLALAANVSKIQTWMNFTDAMTTIYFAGITGGTLSIKVILRSV